MATMAAKKGTRCPPCALAIRWLPLWASLLVAAVSAATGPEPALRWWQLPPLPDPRGFASPFVGVDGGALLIAGGANFPEKQLWDGGRKVWHDRVFAFEAGAAEWRPAGRLPRALGYGVAISTADGVLCLGGSDAREHHAAVFLLQWRGGRLATIPQPPLPQPIALAAGARAGDIVYLAGGLTSPNAPEPLKTFLAFDLRRPEAGWRKLPSWPGPGRSQAVAAAVGDDFFLFSGLRPAIEASTAPRLEYLKDAYHYSPGRGWTRLPDLPHAAAAAASPAPAIGGDVLLIGGVDGTGFGRPPQEFYHVPQRIQRWSPATKMWGEAGNAPVGRVCVSTAEWRGEWILPTGERSAGVRSPEVWTLAGPAGEK
jgi:N-acetylneuraminic acid mutarotase